MRDGLVLWQVADISRDKAREAEAVRGLESGARCLRDDADRAVSRLRPMAASHHLNPTLGGWLGLAGCGTCTRT